MKYSTPIYLLCRESSAEFVPHFCVKKVLTEGRYRVLSTARPAGRMFLALWTQRQICPTSRDHGQHNLMLLFCSQTGYSWNCQYSLFYCVTDAWGGERINLWCSTLPYSFHAVFSIWAKDASSTCGTFLTSGSQQETDFWAASNKTEALKEEP